MAKFAFEKTSSEVPFTNFARDAMGNCMRENKLVTVMTAAMCQGNKLEPVREEFPDRFFDVGICESHAVAFAAGQAKVGLKPIVAIYSTFLQRSYDQVFQEVSLQGLPVVFMMDRGGLAGPDGPTHHGVFDIAYMRTVPQPYNDGASRRTRSRTNVEVRFESKHSYSNPLSKSFGGRHRT